MRLELNEILKEANIGTEKSDFLYSQILPLIERSKIKVIRDLIEESIDRFSNYQNTSEPYIEIRPVLDSVNLLLMKNTAIQIVNKKGESCSTYRVEEINLDTTQANPFDVGQDGEFKILIAQILDDGTFLPFEELGEDFRVLKMLFDEISDDENKIEDKIVKAIKYKSKKKIISRVEFKSYSAENFNFSIKEVVNKLRDLISQSLTLIEHNESLNIPSLDMPNVFNVIRYASIKRKTKNDSLDYTAQIILSNEQKKAIKKNFASGLSTKEASPFIDKFEAPLDQSSRSSADECFKFETVRFENYDENLSKSSTDKIRSSLETELYDKIVEGDKKVFYIPIHLNGAPWMALYRIMPKNRADIDYISFYRTKITFIANQLRSRSFEIFFRLIREHTRKVFVNDDLELKDGIHSINNYCQFISCFFPFYIPVFPNNDGIKVVDYLDFLLNDYQFKYFINSIWANEIDYDNISVEDFDKKLKRELKRVINEIKSNEATKKIIMAAYGMSHFYGNRLEIYRSKRANLLDALKTEDKRIYKTLKDLREGAIDEFDRIYDISGLFTIISKKYSSLATTDFFSSKDANRYLDSGHYELSSKILEYFNSICLPKAKTINLKGKANSLKISEFLNNDKRPYSVLYDNLIIEVLRNFSKTEAPNLVVDFENDLIIFKNESQKKITEASNWKQISAKEFKGAILYFNILLVETKIGSINYKYTMERNQSFFQLGINLKGVQFHYVVDGNPAGSFVQ